MNRPDAIYTQVFTDGSRDPQGVGGWGAILMRGEKEMQISGSATDTTNNAMEIMACIKALDTFTKPTHVQMNTDSTYVFKAMTQWVDEWYDNDWKRKGAEIPNAELWKELLKVRDSHIDVTWVHVPRDVSELNIAHELANDARRAKREELGLEQ